MHDTNLLEDQPIAWTPTPDVIERAQLTRFMKQVGVSTWDELYEFSIRDVEKFTEEVLKFLDIKFDPPYEKLMDVSEGVEFPVWFGGNADANNGTRTPSSAMSPKGERFSDAVASGADEGVRGPAGLNITTMCLDRWQTDEMKDQRAVIWEGEEGIFESRSYSELHQDVSEVASGLRSSGFGKGDAIGIHMPMAVETIVALLAINRIGAIAVPVFSGYGVDAIASRLNAVGAKALFTYNRFPRRGKEFRAFEVAKEAATQCPTLEKVFVVGRDVTDDYPDFSALTSIFEDYNLLSMESSDAVSAIALPAPTSAEDPLIILYTSGTTGKPKGIAHTHASFPIKAAQDMAFGTDVGRGTRICWYTDIGWMMGPWLIYGALINGAAICIYDGAPDYPTPDRMWEFCAKHKVEVLGISPTLVRSLAAAESEPPASAGGQKVDSQSTNWPPAHAGGSDKKAPFQRHDLSSLRIFASTGEPWNPAPWWWLFEKVGNSKLPIINYSGGTEIAGGILMGNPLLPIKPCSFPAPCPGMDVDILDEEGNSVPAGQVGELVIKQPWIGMARGFWQEKERYLETYWRRFKDIWVHGDWAMRDEDGHWFILGRSDDTLKIAGKRVGPAEVESLLVAHPLVTEAAVIGVPDEVKGTAMVAFVVLRNADAPVRNGSERNADALVRNDSERNADALVRSEAEGRTTAATFENKKGWHDRGYLPHFDGVVTQFVTFRLADSLPQDVLKKLEAEVESGEFEDKSREYRKRVEEYLDRGIGECLLLRPEVASLVQETILSENGKSCDVKAWVIMPNHAHVLLRPREGHSLSDILKTIKSVSAHRINSFLGRTGPVWQPDYFDRYIRDAEHFNKTVRYIRNNPVKAGLCTAPEDWAFSSASPQAAIADEGVRVPSSPQAAIADEGVRVPSSPKAAIADEGVRVPSSPQAAIADEGVRVPSSPQAAIADEGVRVPSVDELKALVAKDMGKPLAPSRIHFVSALPKTRNAKVMRRVIRAAYLGEDPGDLSALENPGAVEEIRKAEK